MKNELQKLRFLHIFCSLFCNCYILTNRVKISKDINVMHQLFAKQITLYTVKKQKKPLNSIYFTTIYKQVLYNLY